FEHGDEFFTVDELDRGNAFARGFLAGVVGEHARGDDETLIGAALHGATEVTNVAGGDRMSRVALALEQHLEGDQRVDLQDAVAVDPAVTGSALDDDLLKAALAQEPLTNTLEPGWR